MMQDINIKISDKLNTNRIRAAKYIILLYTHAYKECIYIQWFSVPNDISYSGLKFALNDN